MNVNLRPNRPATRTVFLFLLLLASLAPDQGYCQDTLQSGSFLRIDVENDAFQMRPKNISDRYYTGGLRLTYLSNYWHRWPTRHALIRITPKPGRTYGYLYDLTVGQEIYTPRNTKIARRPLYPNDRPYAGYLYLSWGVVTTDVTGARRLNSNLIIGAIGRVSGAAEVQGLLHDVLGQTPSAGWGAQLKNALAISYYVKYEGRLVPRFSPAFDILGHVEGNIGSLSNFAGTGGTLRIGLFNDYFLNATELYDPNAGLTRRKFQCYAFVGASFRAVADNALLQGGLLHGQDNYYALPAVEMKHFYGQTSIGGVIAYKNARLTFTQYLRTTEFVDALDDQWGQVSLLFKIGR